MPSGHGSAPDSMNALRNKPKDIEEETTEPQQGQGVGGGAKDEPTELNCVYNQNGNLQQSKSDEGCPAEDPTP